MSTTMREALRAAGVTVRDETAEHERRAASPTPLKAPPPLPYVSRRALARVADPLPVPDRCPHCGNEPRFVDHAELYGGRRYGEWPYALACDCGAYVGLHPHTDVPVGTLADARQREARKSGKALFEALRQHRRWSRRRAYRWLANQMDLAVAETHWGWFDAYQCAKAEALCAEALDFGEEHDGSTDD